MTTDAAKLAEKQKKQWVIASILLVIFAWSFVTNVIFQKKPAPSAPVENVQNLAEDLVFVTNLRTKDKQFAEQTAVWDKEWGRDPFAPQATVSSVIRAVNLTLKGILWDDANPKAIVNEKTLVTGDTIYGYTVIQIKHKSVILRTGEKNIELSVFRPVIAEPPVAG